MLPKKHMKISTKASCQLFVTFDRRYPAILLNTEFSLRPWIITISPQRIPIDLKSIYPRYSFEGFTKKAEIIALNFCP